MSLAASVLARARRFEKTVRIGGVTVAPSNPLSPDGTPGVGRINIQREFDAAPTAEIGVNRLPTRYQYGDTVAVEIGYDAVTRQQFSGWLQSPNNGVGESTITASGQLHRIYRRGEAPQIEVTGLTIKEAIESLLELAGVESYNVDASLDYELGTVVPCILPAGPISDMIALLMDIRGAHIWETKSGTVIVRPITFLPAPSASKVYDETDQELCRVIEGSSRLAPEDFRDKLVVTGAAIPDGDPEDPDTTYTAITTTKTVVGSTLQRPPVGTGIFSPETRSNPLIDTQGELEDYGQLWLTILSRIYEYFTIEVPGDPELELGITAQFNYPSINLTGRWFVEALTDNVDVSPTSDSGEVPGYKNYLNVRGGSLAGGNIETNPVAAFTYFVLLQYMGDDLYAIVTVDGSASSAFGGTIEDYTWDINGVSASGKVATVAFLADGVDDFTLELEVEASNGLTDTHTEEATTDTSSPFVLQQAVTVAMLTHSSATPDNGGTWYDFVHSGSCVVGARPFDGVNVGQFCAGDDTGAIYRTEDSWQTGALVLAAVGSRWAWMLWDWRNPLRVWAFTEDGRLYASIDAGATWGLYSGGNLSLAFGISAIGGQIGNPAAGGIWLFGGDGAGNPFICYDATFAGAFVQVPIDGDLLADCPGASTLHIEDAADMGFGLCIILSEPTAAGNLVYFKAPGGTFKRSTGMDPGLTDGRFIVPDSPLLGYAAFHCAVADRNVWHIDASTGVPVCTKEEDVFPADHAPTHAVFESDIFTGIPGQSSGVYLVALENSGGDGRVVKSVDNLLTVQDYRPITGISTIPTDAQPQFLAIGAPGTATGSSGSVGLLGKDEDFSTLDLLTLTWTEVANIGVSGVGTDLRRVAPGVLMCIIRDSDNSPGSLMRSLTEGATWDVVVAVDTGITNVDAYGIINYDVAPNGDVFALKAGDSVSGNNDTQDDAPMQLLRIRDGGDTIDVVYTAPAWGAGNRAVEGEQIAVSANGNKILITTEGASTMPTIYLGTRNPTLDTWSFASSDPGTLPRSVTLGKEDKMHAANSGRWVWMRTSDGSIHTSDDDAATWDERFSGGGTGQALGWWRFEWGNLHFAAHVPSGSNAQVIGSEDNAETWTDIGPLISTFSPKGLDYSLSLNKLVLFSSSEPDCKLIDDPFGAATVTDADVPTADEVSASQEHHAGAFI